MARALKTIGIIVAVVALVAAAAVTLGGAAFAARSLRYRRVSSLMVRSQREQVDLTCSRMPVAFRVQRRTALCESKKSVSNHR